MLPANVMLTQGDLMTPELIIGHIKTSTSWWLAWWQYWSIEFKKYSFYGNVPGFCSCRRKWVAGKAVNGTILEHILTSSKGHIGYLNQCIRTDSQGKLSVFF